MNGTTSRIGVVAIGRNEGDRLKRCLRALPDPDSAVYVDSGSTDDSVAFATQLGVTVVELDTTAGFTAARARNAGWRALVARNKALAYIQFVDGDCEMMPDWITAAATALDREAPLAVVFGRRRERFPEASLFNRMCDEEWNVPIGLVNACGGDAMFRLEALVQAGGFSDDLIAGEEPDLCLRLRRLGWQVRRIDAEMTLHDAAILSLSAWWRRARRSGYAYGAHVLRHGSQADPGWRRQVVSISVWGCGWPLLMGLIALALAFARIPLGASAAVLLVILTYTVQIVRIAHRRIAHGSDRAIAWQYGWLIMIGKFAEFGGLVRSLRDRFTGRAGKLIEYKGPA